MRFVRAFRELMQSTDARTTLVREALHAHAITSVESLFRLPQHGGINGQQGVVHANACLCDALRRCRAARLSGRTILLQTLQEQLRVPLAIDTGTYQQKCSRFEGIEEVCSISLYEPDILNRSGGPGECDTLNDTVHAT